jgi:hypothetical protein
MFHLCTVVAAGRDSSVGIATRYGLVGPGSNRPFQDTEREGCGEQSESESGEEKVCVVYLNNWSVFGNIAVCGENWSAR